MLPDTTQKTVAEVFVPADQRLRQLNANELVFAVVGPIGSGTSQIASALKGLLSDPTYEMDAHIIKARDAIQKWCDARGQNIVMPDNDLANVTALQDAGDQMRKMDPAAVAVELISEIKAKRDELSVVVENVATLNVIPSRKIRVYILDSLKNPAEVEVLRSVYKDAFCLIGVVCEQRVREKRLQDDKYQNSSKNQIKKLMDRDADADITYGQKVVDTFHLADYFVDNSPSRYVDEEKHESNPDWAIPDQLGRLVDLITYARIIRPDPSETGMFYAYGAKMRSACLSRQVGAALLDGSGNVISTGANEVPKAGGGVYGGGFHDDDPEEGDNDHRCAKVNGYCSSNRAQDDIVKKIIEQIPALHAVIDQEALIKQLKKTPIGRLLEFSRAVHAEMDALLSAAREGKSTIGSRLFVTTFPCHYCARHIVSAGVDEVQYIEPYPKSKAISLHGDAITQSTKIWISPSKKERIKGREAKVLFRPFTGVAPRLYKQVFFKDRPLKDSSGNMKIGEAYSASGLFKLSYQDIEKSVLAARGGGDV
ncbi:anti-phage dCTP deaminase [Duganella sp. Dugasp56]|uniref:anti-phage dCTP deaminase n=1 Tax=Duganella sp. Dugasp56 TaxID=3243046 RepID=UPI0039AF2DD2